MTTGSSTDGSWYEVGSWQEVGAWQKVARIIAALWQGPLPRRPATRDPHAIDQFYVQRYAPRKSRAAATVMPASAEFRKTT